MALNWIKARIFLLVDLRKLFFRFKVEGTKKKNIFFLVIFRAFFFFFFFFLISPEKAVKLVRQTNSLY